eukprot:324259-Rhodomonas_salina.2
MVKRIVREKGYRGTQAVDRGADRRPQCEWMGRELLTRPGKEQTVPLQHAERCRITNLAHMHWQQRKPQDIHC